MKLKLIRNLRRQILRGHPWVYKDALERGKIDKVELCELVDNKGFLAWGYCDPESPLAVRVLSLNKKNPNDLFFHERFSQALNLRKRMINKETTAFRLFNGEGDLLPGLVCDVYGDIAVLQFDGKGPKGFWSSKKVAEWLIENAEIKTVIDKSRMNHQSSEDKKELKILSGERCADCVVIKENGASFKVDLLKGQKTGFFLDQRENRAYLKSIAKDMSVLNLFSYTGGFSIYAGLGGAKLVASLDVAKGAIELTEENWELNSLPVDGHKGICEDVFSYLKETKELWDIVLVDPPSMAHSEEQKVRAVEKYIELFAAAVKRVRKGGDIFFSSCSSHISFNDFFDIVNQSLSRARRNGIILRVSGQGGDHPFPHICHELRYLKFVHVSLDG